MNLVNLETVGTPHQEKIESLNERITAISNVMKVNKVELMKTILEHLNPVLGAVEVDNYANINIYKSKDETRWDSARVYIDDQWGSKERTYNVRYSVNSISGNTGEDDGNLDKMVEVTNLMYTVVQYAKDLVGEWAAIQKKADKDREGLYAERRQLTNELAQLKAMVQAANEEKILDVLKNGYSFGSERVYTGYGEDYNYLSNIKLLKNSPKSILIEEANVWSDGTSHPIEFRYKKEAILVEIYERELKKQEA